MTAPVPASIDRPGGRPLAAKVRVSPLGSLALTARLTALPTLAAWLPGAASAGVTLVLSAGATFIRSSLASEGTPASSITNTIHMPGGTSLARAGTCAETWLPLTVKGSSTKRWSMLKLCVTEPVFTSDTRWIGRAPGWLTLSDSVRPGSVTVGAVPITGRVASVALPVNRYGG